MNINIAPEFLEIFKNSTDISSRSLSYFPNNTLSHINTVYCYSYQGKCLNDVQEWNTEKKK